jgi:hypothetical protein
LLLHSPAHLRSLRDLTFVGELIHSLSHSILPLDQRVWARVKLVRRKACGSNLIRERARIVFAVTLSQSYRPNWPGDCGLQRTPESSLPASRSTISFRPHRRPTRLNATSKAPKSKRCMALLRSCNRCVVPGSSARLIHQRMTGWWATFSAATVTGSKQSTSYVCWQSL